MPISLRNKNLTLPEQTQPSTTVASIIGKHGVIACLAICVIGALSCLTATIVTGSIFLIIPTIVCSLIAIVMLSIKCTKNKKSLPLQTPPQSPIGVNPFDSSSLEETASGKNPFDSSSLEETASGKNPFDSSFLEETASRKNPFVFSSTSLIPPAATQRAPFDYSTLKSIKSSKVLPPFPTFISQNFKNNREILCDSYLITKSTLTSISLINRDNGITFTMAQQDIATPLHPSTPVAIVNSANDTMYRNGGGTNNALSKVTSAACWENAKEGRSSLQPGDAVGGLWESSTSVPADAPTPRALIQALGPNVQNTPFEKLSEQLRVLKTAYQNVFAKAAALGCSHVQLPLLSGGIFAPNPRQRPNENEFWLQGSFLMLLEALRELPNDSMVRDVILVDIQVPYWHSFCSTYCAKSISP